MSKLTKERLLDLFSEIDDEYIVEADYTEEEQARLNVAARAAAAIAKEAEEAQEEKRPIKPLHEQTEVNDEGLKAGPEALPNNNAGRILRITFGVVLAAAAILAVVLLWNPDRSDVATTTRPTEQEVTTPEETTMAAGIDVNDLAEVPIDAEHFPDAIFRKFVRDRFDSNADGILDPNEILTVKELRLYKEPDVVLEVSDVRGIEYFPLLEVLECPSYDITRLDVSKNTALKELDCSDARLTELDVTHNPALKRLKCSNTKLTGLDVSQNVVLEALDVYRCGLTSLDISRNPALKELDVSYSALLDLDISHNIVLETLVAMGTKMTQIDTGNNPVLRSINASASGLELLDISNNPALESVIVTPTTVVNGAAGRESIIDRITIPTPLV